MSTSSSDDHEVDIDAVWAQIVARWDDEAPAREPAPSSAPSVQDDLRTEDEQSEHDDQDPAQSHRPRHSAGQEDPPRRPGRREAAHRTTDPEPYDYERDQLPLATPGPRDVDPLGPSFLDAVGETDEEGYVPPEPPPLQRPSLISGLAWAAAVGGPLFLLFCAMFWRSAPSLVVASAVAAFAGGFVTLVLRMSDHDDDDGAVV